MKKKSFNYFIIGLKGFLMGIADAVPGVSGGTIALVTGIYEELIESISNINLQFFRSLKTDSLRVFWKKFNGSFLLSVLTGISIGFLTSMNIVHYLLGDYPIQSWSFFGGLVGASGFIVLKRVSNWNLLNLLMLLFGFFIVFKLTSLQTSYTNNSLLYLFFVGAIGICAMLLPGISGALILLLLGAYKTLKDSITHFDFLNLSLFISGALFGLLSFSKIIKWSLKRHPNITYALLSGLIFGSFNKLWPWKSTTKVLNNKTFEVIDFSTISNFGSLSIFQKKTRDFDTYKSILEENISPMNFSFINNNEPSYLLNSIVFMSIGFLFVFLLDRVSLK